MQQFIQKHFTGVCLFATLFAADRAAKLWALSALGGKGGRFLTLYFNHGISFSMLGGHAGLSLAVSAVGCAVLAVACLRCRTLRSAPGMPFLWAGALGNLIDRVVYGYVVDWLRVAWIYVNLADFWLCIGCLLICIRCTAFHD